jgi:FKBP-type peptidyl-prolyl cis-trans isomerase
MATKEETMDISHDGGLLKRVIKEGDGSIVPRDVNVTIHYTGKLKNGKVFDSSIERKTPLSFRIGRREVILGFDLGVATMRKGEKCLLVCKPTYGYGKAEVGPVPRDSTIEYEVELVDWDGQKGAIGMVAVATAFVFLSLMVSIIASLDFLWIKSALGW